MSDFFISSKLSLPNNRQYKTASVLDIQKESLAEDIWDKTDSGYTLKESIREQVIERVTRFCMEIFNTDTVEYVKGIYIISSIATYFYSSTTDIDIKVAFDYDGLISKKPGLKDIDWDDLLGYLIKKTKNLDYMSKPLSGTPRPIDWFFYDKEELDKLITSNSKRFDSIYDILNRKFIKFTPKLSEISKTEILDYALKLSSDMLADLDSDMGKLRRHTIEYDYYHDYLSLIEYNSEEVEEKLQEVVSDIEKSLEGIYEDKEYFSALRHEAFKEESLVGAYAKLYKSENFSDANLLRKVLEYFGYWKVLIDLSHLYEDIKDDEIEVDEEVVNKIESLLAEV